MGLAIEMLSLVNGLAAAMRTKATVLQFGYATDWPIIGLIEPQYKLRRRDAAARAA
jgi:hypothetical protein